jgi:hypothetical protein
MSYKSFFGDKNKEKIYLCFENYKDGSSKFVFYVQIDENTFESFALRKKDGKMPQKYLDLVKDTNDGERRDLKPDFLREMWTELVECGCEDVTIP